LVIGILLDAGRLLWSSRREGQRLLDYQSVSQMEGWPNEAWPSEWSKCGGKGDEQRVAEGEGGGG
jgi:hypothetical protein